jgi:hypothetical protein
MGLYKRATERGSWWGGVSLVGYNVFLFSLGLYPPELIQELKTRFRSVGFNGKDEGGSKHSDSVDVIGKRALMAIKLENPHLFENGHYREAWSRGFGARIRYMRSAVDIEGVRVGFERGD